jgi:hypothetical protein
VASNRIPGTRVDLKTFEQKEKAKVLDVSIAQILNGEISQATRATLLKQIEQPLPEVKAGSDNDDDMSAAQPNRPGGPGNRQARLLNPTGNPDVFKVISLVLGTPEFQRQ